MVSVRILILSLCGIFAAHVQAQSADAPIAASKGQKLSLRVATKGNGRALKRVEVKIGLELLYTDPQGHVDIILPEREGVLEIGRSGYDTVLIDFKDLRNRSDYTVYLAPGKPDDTEVTITGTRRPEVSRKTITRRETDRIAPGGDPAQIAQLMPGVQNNPGST